ncbi:MAG: hypothetical protein ACOYJ1_00975 [Peptococcales bacterium]|jgi:hypothetical protein
MYKKTYVKVSAVFEADGRIHPQSIELHDECYPVDRVLEVRQAPATKAGGVGIRFTVRIGKHETYLFYDEQELRWFVEEKAGSQSVDS